MKIFKTSCLSCVASLVALIPVLGYFVIYEEEYLSEVISGDQLFHYFLSKDVNYIDLKNQELDFRLAEVALEERFRAYPRLERSTQEIQDSFQFNTKKYTEKFKSKDLRSAKLTHARQSKFNPEKFTYDFGHKGLAVWGELPYPLTRQLDGNLEHYDRTFARSNKSYYQSQFHTVEFQTQLDKITGTQLTSDNTIDLHQNGGSFAVFNKIVDDSSDFVFIQMLAFSCDGPRPQEFVNRLTKKSAEGVDVKLVIDSLFSKLSGDCLTHLENHGIEVVRVGGATTLKPRQHASLILNDRFQMLIGSQNVYWGFFDADGINFLDRDMGLEVSGPAVTDAFGEFLHIYLKHSNPEQDITRYQSLYSARLKQETISHRRGLSEYEIWLDQKQGGLCRFAAQRPNGELKDLQILLAEHIKKSTSSMSFSSVKFDHDRPNKIAGSILDLLKQKAKANIRIDFYGNGKTGGNGELTIELQRLFARSWQKHLSSPSLLEKLKLGLIERVAQHALGNHAKVNFNSYKELLDTDNITVWANSNFTHHKTWDFDRKVFAITSALIAERSFESFYEAGIFCMDESTQKKHSRSRMLDMVNSLPYTKSSLL